MPKTQIGKQNNGVSAVSAEETQGTYLTAGRQKFWFCGVSRMVLQQNRKACQVDLELGSNFRQNITETQVQGKISSAL